jgi:copper resistance protein C
LNPKTKEGTLAVRRCFAWTVPLAVVMLGGSPAAFAHAMLMHSNPADQAVVHNRQVEIALDYDSRIEPSRCAVKLTDAAGKTLPLQMERSIKPSELNAVAHGLANGKYQIHWQVLASDGHITRGNIVFTVDVQ